MPDVDCKIVDIETGTREVDAGEAGELCLRGPNLIDGYWQKPKETAAVLRDGWLYTGEIVFRTELPKTLIGKVLRRQLAACVAESRSAAVSETTSGGPLPQRPAHPARTPDHEARRDRLSNGEIAQRLVISPARRTDRPTIRRSTEPRLVLAPAMQQGLAVQLRQPFPHERSSERLT